MQFEWDRDKAQRNLRKHGISFDEAITVFYDPFSATFDDPDHSLREQRLITIGYSSRERLLLYRTLSGETPYELSAHDVRPN